MKHLAAEMQAGLPETEACGRLRVLVILGHPRPASFCRALARSYCQGARAAGADLATIDLAALRFDPDVRTVSPTQQPLEPDLERARKLIAWADHLVFIYPAWWGVAPARLRGFLDRVLLPGFAFGERADGRFEGLLSGRTAHLIITLDTPPAIYGLVYRAPGLNAMQRSVLGFCGIKTTVKRLLGPVRSSSEEKRSAWLEEARSLGFSLRTGVRSPAARFGAKVVAWLRALRLQFYPMSWVAYAVGAFGALLTTGELNLTLFWIGYATLFFIEAATVFVNECFDYESDRRNRHYGAFTGGSRVLVDGQISFAELRVGIVVALVAAAGCAGLLLEYMSAGPAVPLLMLLMLVLGIGYTAPPLKFAWRGLGELDVAFTHSFGVMLLGHTLQGAPLADPFPWLASVPLFLAVLPAILLSGIPDHDADRQAGKKTLVVRLGIPGALVLAIGLVGAAALSVVLLKEHPALRGVFDGALPWILPHGLLLSSLLYLDLRGGQGCGRIDVLMLIALTYIAWFGLIPLIHLT